MSLILDALNRSRDNVEPVPTLATHHPVESVPAGSRQYLLWAALAFGFLLIVWLVWDRFMPDASPPADTGSPVAALTENIGSAASAVTTELKARADARWEAANPDAVQQAVPSQEFVPVEEASTVAQPELTPAASKTGAAASTSAVVPETQPEPESEPRPEAEPGTAAVVNTEVARLYRDRTVPETPPSSAPASSPEASPLAKAEEQPIDIEEVLQRAQQEREEADLDEHSVPFLTSLSQRTKNDIPTIYYREHDFSSSAGQSTVTLNGKTLRVGGSPGAGIKVEEILPNSVVLSHRGTQFRLRALNSWVNL